MSDRFITDVLRNIPENVDVTINYYSQSTINNNHYMPDINTSQSQLPNVHINQTNTQGSQTDTISSPEDTVSSPEDTISSPEDTVSSPDNTVSSPEDTSSTQTDDTENQIDINDEVVNITISTDNMGNITNIANTNNSQYEFGSNGSYTTHINTTIDYDSDIENLNNVMSLTDALTNSIANSLENIHYMNPHSISTEDMLRKTSLVIYKNIDNPDTKCHICNEEYNEYDICRKNNLCSHYFHYQCIDNWYSRNTTCPICQQII